MGRLCPRNKDGVITQNQVLMMRLWPLTWCKVITTWKWNCKAKPLGRNPDKCSRYNGAIGPSKKY